MVKSPTNGSPTGSDVVAGGFPQSVCRHELAPHEAECATVFCRVGCRLRLSLVAMVVSVAVVGCGVDTAGMKGLLSVWAFGEVRNAAGTCVTLVRSAPGLAAGSQICMKRAFGRLGDCVSFAESDGPVGVDSTNLPSTWISDVRTADNSQCQNRP
jgi:hypothetical protein